MKKEAKSTVVSSKTLLAAQAFKHLSIAAQDELLALMRAMVAQNQNKTNQQMNFKTDAQAVVCEGGK